MAIRQRTLHESALAGGDAKVEDYLIKKGVQWVFHPNVPANQFDAEKSLHNQARVNALDLKRVEQYAEAMKRGDEFPPVIAHGKPGKYVIADGNHRLAAALQSKKPISMYHIEGDPRTIVLITFEANTKHGLPTSEDERVQHALYLIDNGSTIPEAAAALSLKRSDVERAQIERQTADRFRKNKIAQGVIERITLPVRKRLANIYNDEGFVAAVNLTADAALTSGEVWKLVSDLGPIRSSEAQVAYIKEQREHVFAERINNTGGGVFSRGMRTGLQTPKAKLGSVATIISNLPEDLEEISKAYLGPERELAADKLRSAARRLDEIAKTLSS